MITVIPAAGKSSRYFGHKPKWLRTLPEGKLLIEEAISGLLELSDRVLLVITRDIEDQFSVSNLMRQVFLDRLEVIILDHSTNSAVQTVIEGLQRAEVNLNEKLLIKDSDNIVQFDFPNTDHAFSIGVNIYDKVVSKVTNKSFFKLNDDFTVKDFVEKRIISQYISVGTHGFTSVASFLDYATMLVSNSPQGVSELYISNVLALMVYEGLRVQYVEATYYLDLGTQEEWENLRRAKSVYFIDYDGTLVMNAGKYGNNLWSDQDQPITSNINVIKRLYDGGAQIIITTSRTSEYEEDIRSLLSNYGINPIAVICSLNHSQRYLINDFADTNIYPSALAINLPRNGNLNQFFVL
jgi:hypothetical protein